MLDLCYAQTTTETGTGSFVSRRMHTFDNLNRESSIVEIYIPAPENASREESFDWHLATRNFFAFVLGKPLVGRQMGQAFVDLYERMKLFRSEQSNNHQDFLEYSEIQGYRDLVECTDYALASLFYAERYKLRDVWIDAFVHCVGMSDSIALSPESTAISRLSKALITRAYLEIDVHLGSVAKALRTFLQEDFSPAHLGLVDGARSHMHRFQQFLHDFYAEKFGYWPPPVSATFPKALYKSMFYDFQALYDLLADTQSNSNLAFQKPASGGICVLQTVDHFDRRHKFTAQSHPLPLLPAKSDQITTRSLSSASHHRKTRDMQAKIIALATATNGYTTNPEQPKIVHAYMEFEKSHAVNSNQREDKVAAADARKVRWLVIYGTLQYLSSALRAPVGVRDIESPDYPLCCLVAGQPTLMASPVSTPPVVSPLPIMDDYFGETQSSSFSTIEPDCHREDYFTTPTAAKRNTDPNASHKAQLPDRQPSLRSFGPLSSLSARNSRRNSLTFKPASHCKIIVRGYGDGLNLATIDASSHSVKDSNDLADLHRVPSMTSHKGSQATTTWHGSQIPPIPVSIPAADRGHIRTRTPLLHPSQLDQLLQVVETDDISDSMSRSDSTGSKVSSVWTDEGSAASSKSSADGRNFYKASTAEHSGLLGGLISTDGTRVSLDVPEDRASTMTASQKDIHPLLRNPSVQQAGFQFDFDTQHTEATPCTEEAAASIGMAFSAPPSPPILPSASPRAASMLRTMSLTSQKTPYITKINSPELTLDNEMAYRRKSRSSDILSGLMSSPSELRERYNNAIKRLDNSNGGPNRDEELCNVLQSNAQPPIITKTSHATKMPSLRNCIWHDDGKDKKDRRMSSFWRR